MGVGSVRGLLPSVPMLVLVVLLTMPGARANCGEREYSHEGRCCVFCEAGTFVADHCSASHLRGKCDRCKEGKDFTAHENGLEGCLPCRQCKEGQITVRPCTLTQNAECQCKQGYFCADEGCEICQRDSQMCTSIKVYACSTHGSKLCVEKNQAWTELHISLEMLIPPCVTIHFRHPDQKELASNSTDTEDPGLPNQGNGGSVWVISVALLGVSLAIVVVVFLVKKLKCNKAASTDRDAEGDLVQEASQIILKDLSESELRGTFDVFIKEVPPEQWTQLMKTCLWENEINKIISKFPDNREEQSYQMLLIWRNRLGKKGCIINLLDALRHRDIGVYYNVLNTLKSNNIISKVEDED